MTVPSVTDVGRRIAYQRRVARLTQRQLANAAHIALGTLRKIEQGERGIGDDVLDSVAAALGVDPAQLLPRQDQADDRVHAAMPGLSAAIATYDLPDDGPVRPVQELRTAVEESVAWRLSAQYVRITRRLPALLEELSRSRQLVPPRTTPARGNAACVRLPNGRRGRLQVRGPGSVGPPRRPHALGRHADR
ncbi:helix-turn-helix domain-containing protein [Streptomyces cinnamoneus]|uniref:helix-turn-helix domain-containing protein n=1 Tax=Streptomyces cinnamoneus TaxID=53446 RepID=UPI0030B9137F